ncbi:DUF4435 domain-containing protein [Candidatus Halobeggiatoa sp. HSG11]|nr:DUF4435 domain-containing protein [Candidatus Halobeggiatoa sp. HSG11]
MGIKDKVNSDFFGGRNYYNKSKGEEKLITVFVESEDDIPFWKDIFDKSNLRTKIYPGSQTSPARGREEVLKHARLKYDKDGSKFEITGVGKYLILCVDSDCSYLLKNRTENSKKINGSPYIFQTYTYSIENYKCYAESLHKIVKRATLNDNAQTLFNYVDFLKKYSTIIYDLFVYFLYYYTKEEYANVRIDDFSDIIKLSQVDTLSQGEKTLAKLTEIVKDKLTTLDKIPDTQINQFKTKLNKLGVKPENTYLFIKGHTLFDEIVCKFLTPITSNLKKQKIEQIQKDEEISKEKIIQNIDNYNNSLTYYKVLLHNNTDYYECFLMKKIWKDIEKYNSL